MTDTNTPQAEDVLNEAAEIVESEIDPPMSIEEFIDEAMEHPEYACSAAEYLLRAIEHFGTRTITESGDEIERWRFFDDPANDGEHAILGNTELLNDFVENVRGIAEGPRSEEKMFWFEGPTATGKSELKRCLINGLNAFSKTDEGKRFTIDWNIQSSSNADSSMTYGDGNTSLGEAYWHQSPVQRNPLSVLPEETRRKILYGDDRSPDAWVPPDIDPFSEEAYDVLSSHYDGDLTEIVSEDHCRVSRYHVDIGRGIGVLQSEDIGNPRNKLVGQWMPGMVKELDSRGRRNPQALSYDGVLSQGNAGLTIIEDAAHHFDTILKMLSIPEDDAVKIDRRKTLPIDTVAVIISNPDMRSELMKTTQSDDDSYRAIRRRLDLHRIPYLITPSIEAELLHRLLKGRERVWEDEDRTAESLYVNETEIAPHGIEAAAYYDVASRVEPSENAGRVVKAALYDGQEVGPDRETIDDFSITEEEKNEDGRDGIPCTFTRDIIADVASDTDNVVMPLDIIEAMSDGVSESPVFSEKEANDYGELFGNVGAYILGEQEKDVLGALLRDHTVGEDEIEEYIEHVYCWGTDEDTVDPDDVKMEVFEKKHLGLFGDSHYGLKTTSGVSEQVESWREDVIDSVSSYIYENRDGYEADLDEIPLSAVPEIEEEIESNSWDDVLRVFDNLSPEDWGSPIEGTQTEEVKEETVQNMVEMFGYSTESARRTSEVVMDAVTHADVWDDDEDEDVIAKDVRASIPHGVVM